MAASPKCGKSLSCALHEPPGSDPRDREERLRSHPAWSSSRLVPESANWREPACSETSRGRSTAGTPHPEDAQVAAAGRPAGRNVGARTAAFAVHRARLYHTPPAQLAAAPNRRKPSTRHQQDAESQAHRHQRNAESQAPRRYPGPLGDLGALGVINRKCSSPVHSRRGRVPRLTAGPTAKIHRHFAARASATGRRPPDDSDSTCPCGARAGSRY